MSYLLPNWDSISKSGLRALGPEPFLMSERKNDPTQAETCLNAWLICGRRESKPNLFQGMYSGLGLTEGRLGVTELKLK